MYCRGRAGRELLSCVFLRFALSELFFCVLSYNLSFIIGTDLHMYWYCMSHSLWASIYVHTMHFLMIISVQSCLPRYSQIFMDLHLVWKEIGLTKVFLNRYRNNSLSSSLEAIPLHICCLNLQGVLRVFLKEMVITTEISSPQLEWETLFLTSPLCQVLQTSRESLHWWGWSQTYLAVAVQDPDWWLSIWSLRFQS